MEISYLAHQCQVENCNQKYCALNVHARTMFPKMIEFHTCKYFIKNDWHLTKTLTPQSSLQIIDKKGTPHL